MKYICTIISYIFHPFIIPLLGLFILFQVPTLPNSLYIYDAIYFFPEQVKKEMFFVLVILTFAAPVLSLLIMYWNRMISSIELKDRKERIYPFILITFYYILAYFFLRYKVQDELQHPVIMSFLFGVILTFIISFIINIFLKLSLHAVGVFGVAGTILAYYQTQIDSQFWIVISLIIIGGLVTSSRVYLKAHSLNEALIGMAVGFGVLYLTVLNNWFI